MIHSVAHAIPGNSGLLLALPDLKTRGATIDFQNDQLHLLNLDVTLNLTTTPAGHYEIDLLVRPRKNEHDILSSTVKVSETDEEPSIFQKGRVEATKQTLQFPSCCLCTTSDEKRSDMVP